MPTPLILAIDQGTTSTRAIIFEGSQTRGVAQKTITQKYPENGWVEQDPEEIWRSALDVCNEVIKKTKVSTAEIIGIGIANQRETIVVWERSTGKPIHPAVVWQDRRTAAECTRLRSEGNEPLVSERTGLLLDPYFSAAKIAWILDNVKGARARAEAGELAFGTIDSFLIWRLTGGVIHATDATNASRTSLFDIRRQQWDEELLKLFRVPRALLPEVRDCADDYGTTLPQLFGGPICISGVAGDQQAAALGQACVAPGMLKSTYGTGCFALLHTGSEIVRSTNRLLTTVAYRFNGDVSYALEGSIFTAGATIQWLRDGLGITLEAADTQTLAESVSDNGGVFLVPAFTGLGAPHWDPHARGALFGLTRNTSFAHLARAALEAVCYQTSDLVNAMNNDWSKSVKSVRVDGGMVANDWMLQFLADILNAEIERPAVFETTALGAAYLAGLRRDVYGSIVDIAAEWKRDTRYTAQMSDAVRAQLLDRWKSAVAATVSY